MRKILVPAVVLIVALAGVGYYKGLFTAGEADSAQAGPGATGQPAGRGGMGGGMGAGFRPPVTVEMVPVRRAAIASHLEVVGNLIGQQTVEVVPKTGGRLVSVNVRLGDPVRRGQLIAKIEDREIVEQVNQAEASHQVAQATIRQREADLKLAETNLERSRNLFERQLLPKQTLDDNEARYASSAAQLDLARAQFQQSSARLEELKITLANTRVISPVDGFVGKRHVDPGAWAAQNAPIASVVDISSLRLVANVVEKDLRVVLVGAAATVEVDAYPGEQFQGRIARIAPVLDPATRTAEMEIEVPNGTGRLKPGMYARMTLTVESRQDALVVPKASIVDLEGKRGVFVSAENKAQFVPVILGIEQGDRVEVRQGIEEGQRIVSAGANALRNGDTIIVAGQERRRGRPGMAGGDPGRPGSMPGRGPDAGASRTSGAGRVGPGPV